MTLIVLTGLLNSSIMKYAFTMKWIGHIVFGLCVCFYVIVRVECIHYIPFMYSKLQIREVVLGKYFSYFSTKTYVVVLIRSWGWSGGAKVLCILHHWGVRLILAYSWARPAILVVGKGRGGMFLFLLFLHFHSCSSFFPVPLFHLLYSLFYLFSPFLWETTQNDPQGLTCR